MQPIIQEYVGCTCACSTEHIENSSWTQQTFCCRVPFLNPFTPNLLKKLYKWQTQYNNNIAIFHLSELWKAKFSSTVWCDIFPEAAGKSWLITLGSEMARDILQCQNIVSLCQNICHVWRVLKVLAFEGGGVCGEGGRGKGGGGGGVGVHFCTAKSEEGVFMESTVGSTLQAPVTRNWRSSEF